MTWDNGAKGVVWLVAALLCAVPARSVYAGATLTGETGLVTIPTTEILAPGRLRAGVYGDGEIDTEGRNGDRDLDRVDFSVGLGLTKNLEFYAHLPVVFFSRDGATPSEATSTGGLRFGFKYRLMDEDSDDPISLALLGDMVVGLGSDSLPATLDRTTAFGRRETYEIMGILDRSLWTMPSGERATLTLNAGALLFDKPKRFSIANQGTEFRRRFDGPVTTFEAPFEFGAGVKAPLLRGDFGTVAWSEEFRGNMGTVEELRGSIPMQLFSGFRYVLPAPTGLALQGGLDLGLSGVLDQYRYIAGLTWQTPPSPPPARVMAQAPPPPPPPPPVPPVKRKIVLRGVNFDFDKFEIRPDSVAILQEAANTLKIHGDIAVSVEGHTDAKGSDAYNDTLSLRRASAVRDYLVTLGVPAERMTVAGKGEHAPVADNATPEGRAQNRRVELLVK